MPDEVFVIVVVAILAGTLSGVIRQVLQYKQNTLAARSASTERGSGSMTMSELVNIVREAVHDEVAPLTQRVEHLERLLMPPDETTVPPAETTLRGRPLLDDLAEPEGEHEPSSRSRLRT